MVVMKAKFKRREQNRERANAYRAKLRNEVVSVLGSSCKQCGFKDVRALQVDHVNGGGSQEVRSRTRLFCKVVLDSIAASENKYQLLCANCNWIKRYENNEVAQPGTRDKKREISHSKTTLEPVVCPVPFCAYQWIPHVPQPKACPLCKQYIKYK